jgi:hypothetical protein
MKHPRAKSITSFSYGALIGYILCAIVYMIRRDHMHALMFLVGGILWIIVLLIFIPLESDDE